jgi:Arc-like DNA binding domain
MSRKPSETVQLKLRFPERLRQRIESAAARDERSMNAEIVRRLEQSFQKEDLQANQARLAEAAATTAVEKLLVVTEGKIASHRKDQEIDNGRAPTGEHVLDKGKP